MTDTTRQEAAAPLVPCPFCGSDVELNVRYDPSYNLWDLYIVRCIGCFTETEVLRVRRNDPRDAKAEAQAEWNRRAAASETETWQDRDDDLTCAIEESHPVSSGRHDLYARAMTLVGNRHSKEALVALVNHLLLEAEEARQARDSYRKEANEFAERAAIAEYRLDLMREALKGMLDHSCVADAGPGMKDAEDHEAERRARAALAATAPHPPAQGEGR